MDMIAGIIIGTIIGILIILIIPTAQKAMNKECNSYNEKKDYELKESVNNILLFHTIKDKVGCREFYSYKNGIDLGSRASYIMGYIIHLENEIKSHKPYARKLIIEKK